MKTKGLVVCLLVCAVIIMVSGFSSAITASIGNSRMILRVGLGETIEKSILVKNVNDVLVTINASTSGDLKDNLKIKNPNFDLEPGEQKEIYFSLKADKAGKTESRIDIGFKPEKGNGVGLSSTIIVFADQQYAGKASGDENKSGVNDNSFDNGTEKMNENYSDLSNSPNENVYSKVKNSVINAKTLIISSVFLTGILIIGYFYYLTNKSKKSVTGVNA